MAHVTSVVESFPTQFKLEECVSTLTTQTMVSKSKEKSVKVPESAVSCDRVRAVTCEWG